MPPAEVVAGDLLLIRRSAKVPVDAAVVAGDSSSMPATKSGSDRLIDATINKQGVPRARISAVGSDTPLALIVRLFQEAQNSRWRRSSPIRGRWLGDRLRLARPCHCRRGVRAPIGLTLRPEIAAISMSGFSIVVAVPPA